MGVGRERTWLIWCARFAENQRLESPVSLGSLDTLRVSLTAQEGQTAKRAHQVFLLLKDPETGLDVSYPFGVKENGKAKVDLTQKDLPVQFLSLEQPVDARLLIGSFGSSPAYDATAFQLSIDRDPDEPVPTVEVSRYGKLPEIHHVFKEGPKNPPMAITLAFLAATLAALPILAITVSGSCYTLAYVETGQLLITIL